MDRKTREQRDKQIKKLVGMADELISNYNWDLYRKMWTACSDWNGAHEYDAEIFMSETCDDENNVNGFMIEDDVWYYNN